MRERRNKERRSTTLIKKNFQNRFLKLIGISMVCSMLVTMAVFYVVLRIKINQAGFSGYTQERLGEVLGWLNLVLPLITLVLLVIAGIWANHLSFRVAGPLYALEKQLIMLIEHKISRVQLRNQDDEMIPLANLINELVEKRMEGKGGGSGTYE
ncbi:MAG: hypothetical protein JXJ19_06145 [Elusimicrobia bacterium]|nr:hypothetical protein [Elusimicrobiota bacterium]